MKKPYKVKITLETVYLEENQPLNYDFKTLIVVYNLVEKRFLWWRYWGYKKIRVFTHEHKLTERVQFFDTYQQVMLFLMQNNVNLNANVY